jgi:hyperosmotically inducible periplasmic protein
VDKMIKKTLQAAAIAVGVLTLSCAYAQDQSASDTASQTASPAASAPSGKKAMRAADRKLARAVRKVIEHTKGLDATRIAIVAHGGNITLTGSVPAAPQVDLAAQTAKTVPGVTAVVNKLEVGELGP